MAQLRTRDDLKDYCLRSLGAPVIEVNLDEDQIQDRIDEAFLFYQQYHYDAVEKMYLSYLITPTDYMNRYIPMDPTIIGVERILPFSSRTTGINIFDIRYQILINDLYSLMSTDMIYYAQVKQQLELINQLLVGVKPIRFNRHMNKLQIDMDWVANGQPGQYVIIEGWRLLDPNTYTDVYNDMFLKKYTTALLKRQWGINLKKFSGMQLPGGVTINGDNIYAEAIDELKLLEIEARANWELPVDMFVA
jgi:hypothetical protein